MYVGVVLVPFLLQLTFCDHVCIAFVICNELFNNVSIQTTTATIETKIIMSLVVCVPLTLLFLTSPRRFYCDEYFCQLFVCGGGWAVIFIANPTNTLLRGYW